MHCQNKESILLTSVDVYIWTEWTLSLSPNSKFVLLILFIVFFSRFVQEVSVGPLRIILLSYDQLKILHLERKRYDEQTTPKPPFFVVGTDATGKLCAEMKDLKSEKRIFNYTFVKDVAIPGSSENPMIFTFGDMITNDNSWLGISVFYQKLKAMFIEEHKYWPPFQGMQFSIRKEIDVYLN